MRIATSFVALVTFSIASVPAADRDMPAPGDHRNFLSCPIIRDTKTVPCWLAEYEGELYYLGIQYDQTADFYPPQLGHKALVEGTVADEPRICGGLVLKPVSVSVLPELDLSCNTILPAVDQYTVPFARRGPGPNVATYRPPSPPPSPAKPVPPFTVKEFTVYYDFDTETAGRWTSAIAAAGNYAMGIKATKVEVLGYRGASRLTDGTDYVEYPWIAEHRAKVMAETLAVIGVPISTISVRWKSEPEPADGIGDPMRRRLTITVTP